MHEHLKGKNELFAEKMNQFKPREYQNNTRMNIKNHNYAAQKNKRDRQIEYWQNNVIQNHLPPIDQRKKKEL